MRVAKACVVHLRSLWPARARAGCSALPQQTAARRAQRPRVGGHLCSILSSSAGSVASLWYLGVR